MLRFKANQLSEDVFVGAESIRVCNGCVELLLEPAKRVAPGWRRKLYCFSKPSPSPKRAAGTSTAKYFLKMVGAADWPIENRWIDPDCATGSSRRADLLADGSQV